MSNKLEQIISLAAPTGLPDKSLSELAFILNDINAAMDDLAMQRNEVCKEIKTRLPHLNDDADLQETEKQLNK